LERHAFTHGQRRQRGEDRSRIDHRDGDRNDHGGGGRAVGHGEAQRVPTGLGGRGRPAEHTGDRIQGGPDGQPGGGKTQSVGIGIGGDQIEDQGRALGHGLGRQCREDRRRIGFADGDEHDLFHEVAVDRGGGAEGHAEDTGLRSARGPREDRGTGHARAGKGGAGGQPGRREREQVAIEVLGGDGETRFSPRQGDAVAEVAERRRQVAGGDREHERQAADAWERGPVVAVVRRGDFEDVVAAVGDGGGAADEPGAVAGAGEAGEGGQAVERDRNRPAFRVGDLDRDVEGHARAHRLGADRGKCRRLVEVDDVENDLGGGRARGAGAIAIVTHGEVDRVHARAGRARHPVERLGFGIKNRSCRQAGDRPGERRHRAEAVAGAVRREERQRSGVIGVDRAQDEIDRLAFGDAQAELRVQADGAIGVEHLDALGDRAAATSSVLGVKFKIENAVLVEGRGPDKETANRVQRATERHVGQAVIGDRAALGRAQSDDQGLALGDAPGQERQQFRRARCIDDGDIEDGGNDRDAVADQEAHVAVDAGGGEAGSPDQRGGGGIKSGARRQVVSPGDQRVAVGIKGVERHRQRLPFPAIHGGHRQQGGSDVSSGHGHGHIKDQPGKSPAHVVGADFKRRGATLGSLRQPFQGSRLGVKAGPGRATHEHVHNGFGTVRIRGGRGKRIAQTSGGGGGRDLARKDGDFVGHWTSHDGMAQIEWCVERVGQHDFEDRQRGIRGQRALRGHQLEVEEPVAGFAGRARHADAGVSGQAVEDDPDGPGDGGAAGIGQGGVDGHGAGGAVEPGIGEIDAHLAADVLEDGEFRGIGLGHGHAGFTFHPGADGEHERAGRKRRESEEHRAGQRIVSEGANRHRLAGRHLHEGEVRHVGGGGGVERRVEAHARLAHAHALARSGHRGDRDDERCRDRVRSRRGGRRARGRPIHSGRWREIPRAPRRWPRRATAGWPGPPGSGRRRFPG
jgi:hypothetical protein